MRFVRLVVPILFCVQLHAAVIGVSKPAESITAERIDRLAGEGAGGVGGVSEAVGGADAGGPGYAGGGVEAGEAAPAQPKEG